MNLNEEKISQIIQQRLAFKDLQLKRFISKYLDFLCNFDKNPETIEILSKDTLQELEMLEFQLFKGEMAHFIRIKDREFYRNSNEEILHEIEAFTEEIANLKEKLTIETEKQRKKAEFDLICEEIVKFEEKDDINKKVQGIEEEIRAFNEKYRMNLDIINQKEKELYMIVLLKAIFFNLS